MRGEQRESDGLFSYIRLEDRIAVDHPLRAIRALEKGRLQQIPGQPPDLTRLPPGDPFAPRIRFATPRCFEEVPPLRPVSGGSPEHMVAAWYDLPAAIAAEGTPS